MKFQKINLLILSLLIINLSFSQQKNKGYFGKKFYVQIDGLFNIPVFYNLASLGDIEHNRVNGTNFENKPHWINYGYRLSAGFNFRRNIGFGIEIGNDRSYVAPLPGFNSSSYYNHEILNISTFSFIPKFEFAHDNALLPMGLSHQIGIGMEWSSIINKDYMYNYGFGSSNVLYSDPLAIDKPFNDIKSIPSAKRYVLMYDLTMRNPISKSVFITYGFKYALRASVLNQEEDFVLLKNYRGYLSQINRQRNLSLITFHLGVTFAF